MRKEIIGNHTLYLGDCREILPTLGQVDAVLTDPPYEIKNKFADAKTKSGTRIMSFEFDVAGVTENVVIPAISMAIEKSNSFHIFCGFEQYKDIAELARIKKFVPKPWAKQKLCSPPAMPGNWWPSAFELAIYGYKSGAYFNDVDPKRKNLMVFDSYRHGIRGEEKIAHPTQKWLPMIQYLVKTICPSDGVVLDPFMGSGTTGVACENLDCKFIGIEIDEKYFDIACKRVEATCKNLKLNIPKPTQQLQEAFI